MTFDLDMAIQHCHEKAKELNCKADEDYYFDGDWGKRVDCLECAKEHEQLALWLEELKEARKELAEWHKLRPICVCEGIVVYKVKENDK